MPIVAFVLIAIAIGVGAYILSPFDASSTDARGGSPDDGGSGRVGHGRRDR